MKRHILMIFLSLLSLHMPAGAQKMVVIKGKVEGDLKGFNKVYIYGNDITGDSALIQNGTFELSLPFTKPVLAQIYCEYEARLRNGLSPVAMFIDRPGVVYYQDVIMEKGFHTGKLSGMKSATDLYLYNQQSAQASKAVQTLMAKKYGGQPIPGSTDYDAYLKEFQALSNRRTNQVRTDFIRANPDADLSGLILAGGMSSMSPEELEKSHRLLSKRVGRSEYGRMVTDYLAGLKHSAVGQVLPDFSLDDPNDQPVHFSQLKGKYVMIDFWASWCGPCKASFPHMKALYDKYKGERFEIYSISVDQSKPDWLKELKRQQLPWLQALDTKKLAKSKFGINGVPTLFLIDPQGKVLVKDVGLDPSGNGAVEHKLTEIFGAK